MQWYLIGRCTSLTMSRGSLEPQGTALSAHLLVMTETGPIACPFKILLSVSWNCCRPGALSHPPQFSSIKRS